MDWRFIVFWRFSQTIYVDDKNMYERVLEQIMDLVEIMHLEVVLFDAAGTILMMNKKK